MIFLRSGVSQPVQLLINDYKRLYTDRAKETQLFI